MSNDIFSSVYDLSVKLANYDEQIGFLRELAHWLTDQDGIMQERSKNLINIIAPLNERSVLNHRNKY